MGTVRATGNHRKGVCTFMWALGRDEALNGHKAHRCNRATTDGQHRGNHKCKCGRQHGN